MKIFLSVGTQKFPFDRMIILVDDLYDVIPDIEVFGQIGTSTIHPKHFNYSDYLESDAFEERIRWSDIVLTHGGVGTIIKSLNHGKRIIVIPRLEKYGEHVDDHQVQIAHSFEEMNYIVTYKENDSLHDLIIQAMSMEFSGYKTNRAHVIDVINSYVRKESFMIDDVGR